MRILPFDTPRGGGGAPARVGSRVQRPGPSGGVPRRDMPFPGKANGGVFPGGGATGGMFPGGGRSDFGGGGVPRHSGVVPSPVPQHSAPMPLPVQQGGGMPQQAANPFAGGMPARMPENIQAMLAQILQGRRGF